MKRLVAVVASVTVSLAGLAAAPTARATPDQQSASLQSSRPPRPYTPPRIRWTKCTNPTLQSIGARCGKVIVPLDYAHPRGQKIRLAISRLRHKSPLRRYQGVVLANPGGPGGSGLVMSYIGYPGIIPGKVGRQYDWIGWDPRGVG